MHTNTIPSEFMVRVECITFNHAPYIEDAMNGFCMQETDFPYICVIVDDASTDGEPKVIHNYLKKNFDIDNKSCIRTEETDDYVLSIARHKTNHNCFFGVLFLKYNHYRKKDKKPYFLEWSHAKYIAFCEGDDYWIHPKKLQMQVDFLENNDEIGMCYTACRHYNQHLRVYSEGIFSNNGYCDFASLLLKEPATTLSLIFKAEVEEKYLSEIKLKTQWLMGDTPRLLWYSVNSKIYNMKIVTATYRELQESASHSKNIQKLIRFHESTRDIRLFFCDLYPNYGKRLKGDVWRVYYQLCLKDAFELQSVFYIIKYLLYSRSTKLNDYVRLKDIIKTHTKQYFLNVISGFYRH